MLSYRTNAFPSSKVFYHATKCSFRCWADMPKGVRRNWFQADNIGQKREFLLVFSACKSVFQITIAWLNLRLRVGTWNSNTGTFARGASGTPVSVEVQGCYLDKIFPGASVRYPMCAAAALCARSSAHSVGQKSSSASVLISSLWNCQRCTAECDKDQFRSGKPCFDNNKTTQMCTSRTAPWQTI